MKILEILCFILLETTMDTYGLIIAVLSIVGLWMVFKKCGVQGWWALIPYARSYKLGVCAGRESEGRFLAVLDLLRALVGCLTLYVFTDPDTTVGIFFLFIAFFMLHTTALSFQ